MKIKILSILNLVFLLVSCSKNEAIINIPPLSFYLSGNINDLKNQLKESNVLLIYENSYEGEHNGIKKFYFNDSADDLNYYVEVYTVNDEINGINVIITSNVLSCIEFYNRIEEAILPEFKESTVNLASDDKVQNQKNEGETKDGKKWFDYSIKVETNKFLERQTATR